MCKKLIYFVLFVLAIVTTSAHADTLSKLSDVTVVDDAIGGKVAFTKADFQLPDTGLKIAGQNAGGIAIEASGPIYGLQFLPPEGGLTGIDPASISAIPAQ